MHSNDCMVCHSLPNFYGTLGDGEKINLTVDNEVVNTNLHTRLGKCSICHKGFDGYPHSNTKEITCSQCHFDDDNNQGINAILPFENSRALAAEMNNRCYTCHELVYVDYSNGNHAKIMSSGNLSAPLCSDCHSSHSVQPVDATDPNQYCTKCHAATYNSFMFSIHGAELEKINPADVPSCSDCHGSHTLNGPSNPAFLKNSVAVCLKCHQDKAMMDRYSLPADIFDTNVDNYHNLKIDVVGRQDLNVAGNTPVCVDCHGSHSIRSRADHGSSVDPANLLGTCLKCHIGETGFAVAGKAHTSSSSTTIKGVNFIRGFFRFFTPFTIGILVVYILLDVRKLRSERKTSPNNE